MSNGQNDNGPEVIISDGDNQHIAIRVGSTTHLVERTDPEYFQKAIAALAHLSLKGQSTLLDHIMYQPANDQEDAALNLWLQWHLQGNRSDEERTVIAHSVFTHALTYSHPSPIDPQASLAQRLGWAEPVINLLLHKPSREEIVRPSAVRHQRPKALDPARLPPPELLLAGSPGEVAVSLLERYARSSERGKIAIIRQFAGLYDDAPQNMLALVALHLITERSPSSNLRLYAHQVLNAHLLRSLMSGEILHQQRAVAWLQSYPEPVLTAELIDLVKRSAPNPPHFLVQAALLCQQALSEQSKRSSIDIQPKTPRSRDADGGR